MEDVRVAIKDALKTAMKEKDTVTRDVLRSLNAEFKQVEVDTRKELSADQAMDVVMKSVKKRRDTIAELEQAGGREEMLADEKAELAVVQRFLPEQMSREEITVIVQQAVEQTGARSPKEMGKVMGVIMPQVKGKADGKLVNEIVREMLNS